MGQELWNICQPQAQSQELLITLQAGIKRGLECSSSDSEGMMSSVCVRAKGMDKVVLLWKGYVSGVPYIYLLAY